MARKGAALVRELARTAWDAAVEEKSEERTARSLAKVAEALRASAKLRQVLLHPRLTAERKLALAGLVIKLEGQAAPLLGLLVARHAVKHAGAVRRAFEALRAARSDRALVRVWAAAPLTRTESAALAAVLERSLRRPVRIQVTTSKELIGGLKLQVGERIIDGTVRGAFDQLERRLHENVR